MYYLNFLKYSNTINSEIATETHKHKFVGQLHTYKVNL